MKIFCGVVDVSILDTDTFLSTERGTRSTVLSGLTGPVQRVLHSVTSHVLIKTLL
jgi:hypothetical protein